MGISKAEIEALLQRGNNANGQILSVYLNVDQSAAANLNRGYVAALKAMFRSCEQQISEESRKDFARFGERALKFVSGDTPHGKSLVLFIGAGDFLLHRDLSFPVKNDVRWNITPNVRPLIEALDEYERYCVVLVSKEEARLITVHLGDVEEHREVFAADRSKHIKSGPKDKTRSPDQFQRKEEEHSARHYKEVAEALEKFEEGYSFDRIILGGPPTITKELESVLPKRLQSKVVHSISLRVDAPAAQVLAETLRLGESAERTAESRYVEELITAASKVDRAVLELQPTLDALREGRIRKLVYVDGFVSRGSGCTKCGSLFASKIGACPYCGGQTGEIDDLVERLAGMVVNSGGHSENVRGDAATKLRSVGGIGAFLRF